MYLASELNKSLIENQHQWKARIRELEEQKRNTEKENSLRIADLEAQVRLHEFLSLYRDVTDTGLHRFAT